MGEGESERYLRTRERESMKCKYCKAEGYLVMNIGIVDEVCEACGEWQNNKYNSAYVKVG